MTDYKWLPLDAYARGGDYVILGGPSGFNGTPIRAAVCKYDADFRPNQPWVDYAGDSFLNGGEEPTCYMPLPDNGGDFERVEEPIEAGFYWTRAVSGAANKAVRFWNGTLWFESGKTFAYSRHVFTVISKVQE